ncbi:hypothetical protein PABG_12525 [Paracoccidioides brasiliensis Pb03]|nr:hypothetical protein PABG_12525 [Paracoccidioides brasiliensis Pb03]
MEDVEDPEYIQTGLENLYKGSIAMANTVALLQDELSKTAAATAARERRRRASRRLDNQEALEKLRPKWKKVMVELERYCRDKGINVRATKFTRKSHK